MGSKKLFLAIVLLGASAFAQNNLVPVPPELDSLGASFVSLKDNFDLSTPGGRLMFQIIGAMGVPSKNLGRGMGVVY